MEIRVFGDLTVDGGSLSPKERSLLAALVLRSGSVVAPAELADAVWGDDAPSTWPKQLQAFIVRIRRALGPASIVTSRAGYRLAVETEAIDVPRFERLLQSAREHGANGDPARAIDAIERAFALWQGQPYADLAEWPSATIEAARLGEVRAAAEEDLLEARLELGEHRAVIADAEHLVRSEPLRERRWALLATALYRGGRQADALATLRSARARLADDLGIEPGAELVALESAVLRQEPALDAPPAPPAWQGACPYRGLQAFGTDDAEEFFGRDDDVRAALARLARSPFLAISGSSGCGKSSLMLAGLVPALRPRGQLVTVLGSGRASVTELRDALSGRRPADAIVIDQFEELFHAGLPDDEVAAFCALMADAIASGRTVIVSVRSDYLDACAAELSIGSLFAEGVHLVGPLSPAGLRSAVEEPAKLAGLRLETGLVEIILRDAACEPGALPHVSHALVETWLRREGATLTVAGYEKSGGISGAIAQSADQLYQSLDPAQREICRATLLRLVEIGSDGAPMRRRIRIDPLREDAAHDQVLTSLERARLVSAEEDTLVVAHESLATSWPRLRGWLEDDADGSRAMHALTTAASTWEVGERPEEDLYRGSRLQAAVEWREKATPELTRVEEDFLEASTRRARADEAALADRARHDRRQNRQLRTVLGIAVGLLVLSIAGTGMIVAATQETAREREAAVIGEVTSISFALRASERDVAALIAAEAFRRWPGDARTRSALLATLTAAEGFLGNRYIDGAERITGDLIPSTRNAVIVRDNKAASIVDVRTGRAVRDLEFGDPPTGCCGYPFVRVSADGKFAAVLRPTEYLPPLDFPGLGQSRTSELIVIDLKTGNLRQPPIALDIGTGGLELSPDGNVAAVADTGSYNRVDLVDVGSGTSHEVLGHPGGTLASISPPSAIAYMPDGTLVIGSTGNELAIVDPDRGEVTRTIRIPAMSANAAIDVTSDGRVVAAGVRGLIAVDVKEGTLLWSRPIAKAHPTPCAWIAIAEPRSTLYCADLWGGIEELSLETGDSTGRRMDPQLGIVGPITVSAGGSELIAIGGGSTALSMWRLDGTGLATRLVARGSAAMHGYSPDMTAIITAKRLPGAVQSGELTEYSIWDPAADRERLRVPGTSLNVAWAGPTAIVGLFDSIDGVGFLDARSGAHLPGDAVSITTHRSWLLASGTRLYTADADGTVASYDGRTQRRIGAALQFDGTVETISGTKDASLLAVTVSKDGRSTTFLVDNDSGVLLPSELVGPDVSAIANHREVVAGDENRLERYGLPSFSPSESLPGARGGLASLQVSSDGATLLAGANDETVALYDLEAGIRLGDPIRTSSPLVTAAFLRPDGLELLVNVTEGVAVWDLNPGHQREAACRMAGRDLTREEWATYFGAIGPYRSTCGYSD